MKKYYKKGQEFYRAREIIRMFNCEWHQFESKIKKIQEDCEGNIGIEKISVHSNNRIIIDYEISRSALYVILLSFPNNNVKKISLASLESELKNKILPILPFHTEGKNIEYLNLANTLLGFNLPIIFINTGGKDQILGVIKTNSKSDTVEGYIFDCDAQKEYENAKKELENSQYQKEKILLILPKQEGSFSDDGIENMFNKNLLDVIRRENIYNKKRGKYGAENEEFDKNKFLDIIKKRNNPEDFANFQPLFEEIKEILNS